jgi:hypothetical protein
MLKSITGVYIGGVAAVSFADYICNFFLVCFIFDGGPFLWKGGGGMVWYRNSFKMVVEDTKLSVCGRGTPNAHSLGWGMGGVKPCQITSKVKPLYNC